MVSSSEGENSADEEEKKAFIPIDHTGTKVDDKEIIGQKLRVIIWFRNDIRMHDNPALAWAVDFARKSEAEKLEIVPLYCFDPRIYTAKTQFGTRKTGAIRTMFNIDSVNDFRKSLEAAGSKLLIMLGKPEECISRLLIPGWDTQVVYTQEISPEDLKIQNLVNRFVKQEDKQAKLKTVIK